jgi:hypothetical protein
MTAPATMSLFTRTRHALVCTLILRAVVACDERTSAQAEPPAPVPTASSAPAAALHPPAPPASAAAVEPSADPNTLPASGGAPSALKAPAQASSAPPPSGQTDPKNPCATRYEERVGPDGQVTRVLIPKDKRCGQLREGGLSPRGDVYGY